MSSSKGGEKTPPAYKTVSVRIEGRVQGVYYRAWTEQTARDLGVDGWVRNRRDGSVEAVFSGLASHVDEIVQRCAEGPPDAQVTYMDVTERGIPPEAGFRVLSTE